MRLTQFFERSHHVGNFSDFFTYIYIDFPDSVLIIAYTKVGKVPAFPLSRTYIV